MTDHQQAPRRWTDFELAVFCLQTAVAHTRPDATVADVTAFARGFDTWLAQWCPPAPAGEPVPVMMGSLVSMPPSGLAEDRAMRAWALSKALERRGDGYSRQDIMADAEAYYRWVRDGLAAPAAVGATEATEGPV